MTLLGLVGGLGIFLLGMAVMTDGLRSLAGERVRQALMQYTKSPLSGAGIGALGTALLQSSSATTVTAVGFVAAGLLPFSHALGIIFGANLGTTITGWLVALLGFKLKLSLLALPLIFIGVLFRLFGGSRLRALGYSIAGFGLIFVGISTLQEAMMGLQGVVTPDIFPTDNLLGILKLVAIGIVITLVTQSSSAGVASALTALYTGTIEFQQAAALVIGMDIGTTITAAVATIGGGASTRRTGLSHVVYNLFTGVGALLLLHPYVWFLDTLFPAFIPGNGEIALVLFHSMFNTLGVLIVIPITPVFSRLMFRLVPENEDVLTAQLDQTLLTQPPVALMTLSVVIGNLYAQLLKEVERVVERGHMFKPDPGLLSAIGKTQAYADRIHLSPDDGAQWQKLISIMHILDHMLRLQQRVEGSELPQLSVIEYAHLQPMRMDLDSMLDMQKLLLSGKLDTDHLANISSAHQSILKLQDGFRAEMIGRIANGELEVPEGTHLIAASRWLQRTAKHLDRMAIHYVNLK